MHLSRVILPSSFSLDFYIARLPVLLTPSLIIPTVINKETQTPEILRVSNKGKRKQGIQSIYLKNLSVKARRVGKR